jgi:hypothetical protein
MYYYEFHYRFTINSKGYDSLWAIIDQLTKFSRFLFVNSTIILHLSLLGFILDDIVTLHDVLLTIISDRKAQFTVQRWRSL